MGVFTLHYDSAVTTTVAASTVLPVLTARPNDVAGFYGPIGDAAGFTTVADIASFITTSGITSITFTGRLTSVTGIATPSALVATTFTAFASTVSGAVIMGFGTTFDVTLKNQAGTDVVGVVANSTAVTLAGNLTAAGTTITFGAAGAANNIAGTTTALTPDAASGATTVKANIGTGAGAVGGFIFQVPVTHASDSIAQTLTTALTIGATTAVTATFAAAVTISNATVAPLTVTTGTIANTHGITITTPSLTTGTTFPSFVTMNSTVATYHYLQQDGNGAAALWVFVTGTGDPMSRYTTSGVTDWTVGLDNSDSDAFVIAASAALGTSNVLRMTTTGNVQHVFGGAQIATNATAGFLFITSCNGTPTGVPASIPTGTVPMVYDTSANKFWLYNGSWRGILVV